MARKKISASKKRTGVVRRYDKQGRSYYFNQRSGKRTSKKAWKVSLSARQQAPGRKGKGVFKRFDKQGRPYYINKKTGKRTSKQAWKVSKAARRRKKKPVVPKETFRWAEYYNQAANTILQQHLLDLKFKIFVSLGAERIRIYQQDAFKLKWLIEDIIEAYMDLADVKGIASPYVIFWIKSWVLQEEMELALDYTDFVGVDPMAIPMYEIFKKRLK